MGGRSGEHSRLVCSQVLPAGRFGQPADTVTLDETARNRRRIAMRTDNGMEFLLDLDRARLLRHGEGLLLTDGRIVEVRAEPEPLYEVRGRDGRHLLALAWQIGNRHLAAQLFPERILVRADPVIGEMLIGLGATLNAISAPFDPEGGAYGDHRDSHSDHRHTRRHAGEHDHG